MTSKWPPRVPSQERAVRLWRALRMWRDRNCKRDAMAACHIDRVYWLGRFGVVTSRAPHFRINVFGIASISRSLIDLSV